MNATRAQLVAQYNRAKKLLWTEHFREAANTYTPDLFDTADLMAIASRETNLDPKWLTRKGDNGHGAGLMQIDDRSFPEFTNSTKWKDARLGILYGAKVLRQKWDDLQKNAGKKLTVKNYSFTGPHVTGITAQQIAIAAYNSGRWAAYHYTKGRHPDYGTTGKDYSADVMARARIFRELLGKDGMLDKSSAAASTAEGKADHPAGAAAGNPPQSGPANTIEPPPIVPVPVAEVPAISAAPADTPKTDTPAEEESTLTKLGNKANAVYTAVGGVASGVIAWLSGASTEIIIGASAITISLGGLYMYLNYRRSENKADREAEDKRLERKILLEQEFELKKIREQHAQEAQMYSMRSVAEEGLTPVTIKAPPPVTELPNADAPAGE